MNRYFYTTIFLVWFIAFIGVGLAVSTPAINKPADNWKIVELKGIVNNANGECELWSPGEMLAYWDDSESYWIDFGCDEDYKRFAKYQNAYVYLRCYETSRGLRGDATAWTRSYIYIDCREVVAK